MTFKVKEGVQVGSTLALDANGKLTTGLSTGRSISLTGDVAGSATFDGTANISIATTVQPNSVALGTDTTGNYMVNVLGGTGVSVSHTQSEGSTATVSIGQPVATTDDVTFANINASGNLVIDGNLTVNGTTTTISASNLAIEDNLIYLNEGSTVANPDLGITGNYNDGTYAHAGVFRDATDNRWKFFKGYTPEPSTSIDTTHASFAYADVQAGTFYGALSGNASTASTWQTARTLSYTGDATGSMSVNGSANVSTALTLATVNSNVGTFNNVTVNAKGLVTAASNVSYLTSYTETDTLATVTARGSSTSTANISFNGGSTTAPAVYLSGATNTTAGNIGYTQHIRDTTAATSVAGMAGLGFSSAPGMDFTIGKHWTGSVSQFAIKDAAAALGTNLLTLSTTGVLTLSGSAGSIVASGTTGNKGGYLGNLYVGYGANYNTIQTPTNVDTVWLQYAHSGNVGLAYGGGYTTGYGSVRSPIFYDSDNTSYYADFASTNTSLNIAGGISTPTMWVNYSTANNNGYNENIRLYPATNNVSVIAFGASGTSGTPWNSILGYSDRFEVRQGSQWQQRNYANYVEAYGSFRAPIFYDSNNTGYYSDQASTSQYNVILANGVHNAAYTSGSLTSGTWYTIAANAGDRASAKFIIVDQTSGLHQAIEFNAAAHYGTTGTIAVLSNSFYSGPTIAYIRLKQGSTYDGAVVQVYVNSACSGVTVYMQDNYQSGGWVLKNWINDNTNPGTVATWANLTERTRTYLAGDRNGFTNNSRGFGIGSDANTRLTQGNSQALRIGNDYGYLDIGSQNTSWLHYYTDRAGNYWDKYGENVASWRAPIFYDSNDTAFYLDPNSTSTLNTANITTLTVYGNSNLGDGNGDTTWVNDILYVGASDSGDSHFYLGENSSSWYGDHWYWDSAYTLYRYSRYAGTDSLIHYHDTRDASRITYGRNIVFDNYGKGIVGTYSATRYQGVFAMGDSYKLPADGTTTGTLYGLAWSHPNAGGVAANLNTHGLLAMENGTWLASLSGSVRARDDMRAPIFYDSNDTSYYINPNSLSVFNQLNMWGRLAVDNPLDYASSVVTGLTSAPLSSYALYDTNVGSTSYFLPFTHQTALYTSGYRTHCSTGLYKYASGWGDNNTGWYVALGGSDSYPTMHWKLTYGTDLYNSNGYVSQPGSFRAPIFYDTNDTAYYVDPRSASVLSGLKLNGVDNNASGSDYILWINKPNNNDWGVSITGQYDYNYMYDGAASHSYGVRGLAAGGEYWRVGTDLLYHNSNIRAPIFYDTDNTGYYVDPASTTYINVLTTAGNITSNSDIRLKRDIQKITNATDKVKKLNGVTFTRIDVEDTTKRYAGLIAQEVLEVLPEAVEGTATYSVAYGNMVGLLVEAIKEQQSEIDELKALVKQLLAK